MAETGRVAERVEFPNGSELFYELKCGVDVPQIMAALHEGCITVSVPEPVAREWAGTERVGIEGEAGPLTVLIEKDFQCVHGARDPDAYEGAPKP